MAEKNLLEQDVLPTKSWLSKTALLTALAFGIAALVVVLAGLTIPIPGSTVVTDPRELFTTIGAGLSGPVGGILIGILAGIAEPGGIALASLLAHIAGGIWMGFAYKKLVYERLQMPARLLGWAGLVLVYYYVFVLPGFAIGLIIFYGETTSFVELYANLAWGALPEALLTTIITSLVMLALPEKYRRPLW
jgi:LytS/YehU family sensor histidine kinase